MANRRENVIVGGDMKFILRQGEVWGELGWIDPLAYFLV